MTLIVAPASGYDSLVSVADAETYAASMGVEWDISEPAKEAALRRATQYVMGLYAVSAKYIDPVDSRVAAACCEAAFRSDKLFPDEIEAQVHSVKASASGVEKSFFEGRNARTNSVRFPVIDALLSGVVGSGAKVVRQ